MDRCLYAFEEHGEVLAFWSAAGVTDATLICLDQHLDLKTIARSQCERILRAKDDGPQKLVSLCKESALQDSERFAFGSDSFLYAAAVLGLFREVVWVHPEPQALDNHDLAAILWRHLSLVPDHGSEILSNFRTSPHGASTRVRGMTVSVTTLGRLSHLTLDGDVRLDVDLDFFYSEARGELVHSVDEVVPIVESASGVIAGPPTLAYSVGSGHLPARYRHLGATLASSLRCQLRAGTDRPARLAPDIDLLARGEPLGGIADRCLEHAVRAERALEAGNIADATSGYANARAAGHRATSLAYKLGLYHLQRQDYRQAMRWFDRITSRLDDSIAAHALCLSAICAYRLRDYASSLKLAQRLIDDLPLREEGHLIASLAERTLRSEERSHWDSRTMPASLQGRQA